MKNTASAKQNKNGTFEITVNGKVERKASKRFFPTAFIYTVTGGFKTVRFAADSQLHRLYGAPELVRVDGGRPTV